MKIFLASGFVLRPMKLRMNRFVETDANSPFIGALLRSQDRRLILLNGNWGSFGGSFGIDFSTFL